MIAEVTVIPLTNACFPCLSMPTVRVVEWIDNEGMILIALPTWLETLFYPRVFRKGTMV